MQNSDRHPEDSEIGPPPNIICKRIDENGRNSFLFEQIHNLYATFEGHFNTDSMDIVPYTIFYEFGYKIWGLGVGDYIIYRPGVA